MKLDQDWESQDFTMCHCSIHCEETKSAKEVGTMGSIFSSVGFTKFCCVVAFGLSCGVRFLEYISATHHMGH